MLPSGRDGNADTDDVPRHAWQSDHIQGLRPLSMLTALPSELEKLTDLGVVGKIDRCSN